MTLPEGQSSEKENVPASLGSRLRTLRKQRSLSQVDVAVAVGLARSYLSKLETDQDRPGREVLMALAQYYEVSLDWLASGQGPMRGGEAKAQNEEEALLLYAFRQLPAETAKPLLQMILSQAKRAN